MALASQTVTRLTWRFGCALAAMLLPLATVASTSSDAGRADAAAPASSDEWTAGPDLLRQPLATSPALENTGVWRAEPIMVSGASAYRDGEFVYQDFLYDDLGDGTTSYPADPAYAGNAADLVEVRVRPLSKSTAFRLTYNTLVDASLVATTLALGGDAAAVDWPHEAGVRSPAQVFVTVHGDRAEVVDAAGRAVSAVPRVTVDSVRRHVEVRVPHAVFDPTGRRNVRLSAGAGLWDVEGGHYRQVGEGAALVNMAFRFRETTHPRGIPIATWWRDSRQRDALASGDVSEFAAHMDFTKLAARVDDDMPDQPTGVPVTGSMTRIHVTHFSDGQGRGTTTQSSTACEPPACSVQFRGDLQPYWIHVPAKQPGDGGYGLTAYLHGCGNNQHELFGSQAAQELSSHGPATLVIAGGARGDCLWYQGVAMANLFEIWADVASQYRIDRDLTTLTGYSMGGYGTLRIASLYPDLFARIIGFHPCTSTSVAGTGTDPVVGSVASLRHVPVALWNSVDDPLCTYASTRGIRDALDQNDAASALFTLNNDHFTDMTNDVLTPAIDWQIGRRVERDPARVSYVLHPEHAYPQYGLDPDHAYWVSGLRARDTSLVGTVDVRTEGLGRTDATPGPLVAGSGVLTEGELFPALPFTFEVRSPGVATPAPRRNLLHLTARNVAELTVDPRRAGLSCDADVRIDGDGPVSVHLLGCDRTVTA